MWVILVLGGGALILSCVVVLMTWVETGGRKSHGAWRWAEEGDYETMDFLNERDDG